MKKILIWGMSPYLGGVETYLLNFLNNAPEHLKIDFTCPYNDLYFSKEIICKNNANIVYIYSKKTHPLRIIKDMVKILEKKYDVIYFNICGPSLPFLLMLIISKIFSIKKRIIHCHANQGFHISDHSLFRSLLRICATDVWSCSNEAAVWLYGEKIMRMKNYKMINNSINSSLFKFNLHDRNTLRTELKLDESIVIGTVGRLSTVKNQKYLINALPALLKLNPLFKLVIIGSGELETELHKLTKVLQLEKDVIFLNSRKDIHKYYNLFDYFCLPSLNEGFPMTLLEAQANGLICLVSNSITQEVNLTKNVRTININNQEALFECLQVEKPIPLSERDKYNNIIKNSNYDVLNNITNILDQMGVE